MTDLGLVWLWGYVRVREPEELCEDEAYFVLCEGFFGRVMHYRRKRLARRESCGK